MTNEEESTERFATGMAHALGLFLTVLAIAASLKIIGAF